jgi:hypothetical protein
VKKTRQNLKSFAGIGVTYSDREEAEAEGQHGDVQHEVLLWVEISGAGQKALSLLLDGEVPPDA